MPGILLITAGEESARCFFYLEEALRNMRQSAVMLHWARSCSSLLKQECVTKDFVLVGIAGELEEVRVGFEILASVTDECKTVGVGVCMDAAGYAYCFEELRYVNPQRVRFGLFLGQPAQFPRARVLIRLSEEPHFVSDMCAAKAHDVGCTLREIARKRLFSV